MNRYTNHPHQRDARREETREIEERRQEEARAFLASRRVRAARVLRSV